MYQQQPSHVCFGKSCSTYSKKVGAPSLRNWRFSTDHQKIDFCLGGWFSGDIFHFVRGAVFRSTWCSTKVDFTKSQLHHGIFRLGFFWMNSVEQLFFRAILVIASAKTWTTSDTHVSRDSWSVMFWMFLVVFCGLWFFCKSDPVKTRFNWEDLFLKQTSQNYPCSNIHVL